MNAPQLLTDDALDRVAIQSHGTAGTPAETDPSEYAWRVTHDRLLALPDDVLVAMALDCARCDIEEYLAAVLRRAIREERELPTVVQALYDADELEQAAEARRQDSDGWLA